MNEHDYAFFAKLLLDHSALVLEPGKEYLLDMRLTPLLRKHGLDSLADLARKLRGAGASSLIVEVIEAMVTTETSFFRDISPFETLRATVIPELIAARSSERRLNIWCAASSSGQEPYTLAILLKEYFPLLDDWKIHLVATDISREMLARCRAGRYSQLEVNRGLPIALLLKYFHQDGAYWELRQDIRSMVDFQQLNLMHPFPHMTTMDLILLRNVMIYFEVETKKMILQRMVKALRPDGYLILGGAETTFNLEDRFQRVEHLKSGFYRVRA